MSSLRKPSVSCWAAEESRVLGLGAWPVAGLQTRPTSTGPAGHWVEAAPQASVECQAWPPRQWEGRFPVRPGAQAEPQTAWCVSPSRPAFTRLMLARPGEEAVRWPQIALPLEGPACDLALQVRGPRLGGRGAARAELDAGAPSRAGAPWVAGACSCENMKNERLKGTDTARGPRSHFTFSAILRKMSLHNAARQQAHLPCFLAFDLRLSQACVQIEVVEGGGLTGGSFPSARVSPVPWEGAGTWPWALQRGLRATL